jgi:hypothetical protein
VNSRRPPAPSRRPRPLALPWVVLCLLAYLGSAAHFVLVQHRTCLEHGELMHEEGAVPSGALARSHESFEDSRVAASEGGPAVSHGVEAHCAQALVRRDVLPPVEELPTARSLVPEQPEAVAVGEAVEPPVAWLRLAPKASPPRV